MPIKSTSAPRKPRPKVSRPRPISGRTEQLEDELESRIISLAEKGVLKEAARRAIESHRISGRSRVLVDGRTIVREFADGRRVVIRELPNLRYTIAPGLPRLR